MAQDPSDHRARHPPSSDDQVDRNGEVEARPTPAATVVRQPYRTVDSRESYARHHAARAARVARKNAAIAYPAHQRSFHPQPVSCHAIWTRRSRTPRAAWSAGVKPSRPSTRPRAYHGTLHVPKMHDSSSSSPPAERRTDRLAGQTEVSWRRSLPVDDGQVHARAHRGDARKGTSSDANAPNDDTTTASASATRTRPILVLLRVRDSRLVRS